MRHFSLVLALLVLFLAGCGGGGASPTVPPMPFATRIAAMDAIGDETDSLTFDNFVAETPRILAFLRSRPEIASANVEPLDDRTIWATFTDGRLLIISRNREPDPSLRPNRGRDGEQAGSALPGNDEASLFFSFAESYFSNAASVVAPVMATMGFDGAASATGTLAQYQNLGQTSVLYIDSHGVPRTDPEGNQMIYLQSGTFLTDDTDDAYQADLATQDLAYVGRYGSQKPHALYFSPRWVRRNVRLTSPALVFANTCYSLMNSSMSDAFRSVGATAYIGWNKAVADKDAAQTAYRLFDQLAGKPLVGAYNNQSEHPSLPQTWASAVAHLRSKTRPGGTLLLSQSQRGCEMVTAGTNFGLGPIRPVIQSVIVNEENNRVILSGTFGATRGTVSGNGGTALPIINWSASTITLSFTAGISDYQVTAGGILSNVFGQNLSEYILQSQSGGAFALKEAITVWVSGVQVFAGSGTEVGPIRFQARAGQTLRVQIRSTDVYGGCGDVYLNSPITTNYRIFANALDLFPAPSTGIVRDQTFTLQE